MTKVSKEFALQRKSCNMLKPIEFNGEIYYPIHFHYGYYIGINGEVYSAIIDNIKKINNNGQGYMTVSMVRNDGYKYTKKVHQLVADMFYLHNKEGLVPNHKNFNRSDNKVSNIELVTREDNYNHMYNSFLNGERSHDFRLDKEKVLEIFNEKGTLTEVSKKYKVNKGTVYAIKTKKSYTKVTKNLECDYKPNKKHMDIRQKYLKIWLNDYLHTNKTLKDTADNNKVDRSSMGDIWRKMGLPTKNKRNIFKMSLLN